jgi:hypothetical protein
MVEAGYLTAEQWRKVVCDNTVELYTRANPSFFEGTRVTLNGPGAPGATVSPTAASSR